MSNWLGFSLIPHPQLHHITDDVHNSQQLEEVNSTPSSSPPRHNNATSFMPLRSDDGSFFTTALSNGFHNLPFSAPNPQLEGTCTIYFILFYFYLQ